MLNNPHTPMDTFTLTPQQLADLVDKAFDLGKVYATDELNTLPIGFFANTATPVYKRNGSTADAWTKFLDKNGGHGLHSGDAKADVLFDFLKDAIREKFHATVDFD